ncbi:hypothetical protein P389DRAFT_55859 [Cystobasidium minutum MCA 4210]|uniref:uncharacterized protein n=1 Tax=Cystobasidium minutum MCA 4210 TaxID=1397322 RepID=UPI0034CFD2B2|eukprot:jgi/Rhomi1/55859/CE55858_784
MTSQSIAERSITISYDISVPSNTSLNPSLEAKRSVSIAVPNRDLTNLSQALDRARSETNATLTMWKDEIGEIEKVKEARVVREAEERKKAKKKAAAAASANGEDDGESEEEDENED